MREQFKETEIGRIPKSWSASKIVDCFDIQQGKQMSARFKKGNNLRPFLKTSNLFWGRLDFSVLDRMEFTDKEMKKLVLMKNDLLICEGGDIGRTAICEVDYPGIYYQNHIHRLRPKKTNILQRYFMYWMHYAWLLTDFYLGAGNKTTIPNLSKAKLGGLYFANPSIIEQSNISHILSTLQHAIEKQQQIIDTIQSLKKSLLHQLFTQGIKREKLKETVIGMIPESWKVKTIGEVINFSSGKSRPKNTIRFRSEKNSVPVYGGNGILGYTTESLFQETKLILGRVGEYCGCSHITEDRSWISDNALYAKEFLVDVNLNFFKYFFDFFDLNRFSNKNGQPLITQGGIKLLQFGMPEKIEQIEISNALDSIEKKIMFHKHKKHCYDSLFKSFLNELMSGNTLVNSIKFGVPSKLETE